LIPTAALALYCVQFGEGEEVSSSGAGYRWIAEVDLKLRREWCVSAADAGLSKDDLKHHWATGVSACDFVAWFAEKYDLIRFEREPLGHFKTVSL
jgi:hypothetical protein